ncbi:hypothetical protein KCU76_g45, partial [Aureobasidium melanogenum]
MRNSVGRCIDFRRGGPDEADEATELFLPPVPTILRAVVLGGTMLLGRGVGEVDGGAVAVGGRGGDGAIAGCERGTRVESPARERRVY